LLYPGAGDQETWMNGTMGTAESAAKRLLIVDDEETLLLAMERYFSRIGCRVTTAREREEAGALLEHEGFDLIILDLALSRFGLEGFDLLRDIRYSSQGTPVLILSAHVNADVEADALRRGADAVLAKPQPLSELARIAVRLMGVAR
jgi:DNA-binding response OmpR family regulator